MGGRSRPCGIIPGLSWPPRFLLPGAEFTARVLLVAGILVPLVVLWNGTLARGDAHRAAVVVLGGVAALLLAWHRLQAPPPADLPARGDRWIAVPFAVVLLAGALSLLPLPRGALELLAPETARLYGLEEAAAGTAPAARPLSIEPVATWRSGLLGAAYLAFLLMLAPVARRATLARRLALALAAVGVLAAFMSLWGLAELPGAAQFRGRPTFPLVNPNHLCTLFVAALGLALGAMLVPLDRGDEPAQAQAHEIPAAIAASDPLGALRRALGRRGFAGILAGLLVVGILGTRSRAGALAAALTAVLAVAVRLGPGRRLVAAGALLALGGGLLLGDLDSLKARFDEPERLDTLGGRIENWSVALRVIDGRRLGGSGLGTFRDASVAAVTSARAGNTRPGEAHDDYLELLAGIGVPLGALALGALGVVIALAVRRTRAAPHRARAVAQGALAATGGVLFHALFDFALQIPAPALLALGALALAFFAPRGEEEEKLARALEPPGPLARAAPPLLLALALLACGLPLLLRSLAEADARVVFEKANGPQVNEKLRPELFRRAEQALRPLDDPAARADIALLRRIALEGASAPGWETPAEQAARAAVERAPGRAETQAGLALLLLHRWRRLSPAQTREPAAARLLQEYEGRMALAVELAPTTPAILRLAGECALERLARTGDAGEAERALALFREATRRDPAQLARARAAVKGRAAVLGEQGERLLRALEAGP